MKQNFAEYAIFAKSSNPITTFIKCQFLTNAITHIYNKNPKSTFLGHLWPFSVISTQKRFSQRIWLSHRTLYRPLIPCQVARKNTWLILKKGSDTAWMKGETDRHSKNQNTLRMQTILMITHNVFVLLTFI